MKTRFKSILAGAVTGVLALLVLAYVPALTDFNVTQFGTAGNTVNIVSGVLLTNAVNNGTLTSDTFATTAQSSHTLTLTGGNIFSSLGIGFYVNGTAYLFLDSTTLRPNTPGLIDLGSATYPWSALNVTNFVTPTNSAISGYVVTATGAGGATAYQPVATNSPTQYITNLFSTTAYITNLFSATSYITNLFSTTAYITNLTVNNFFGLTNDLKQLTITNGLSFVTNSWPGPTNVLDMSLEDQYFAAGSDCSITGIVSKPSNQSSSVILTITNSATTNITLRLPGFTSGDGSRQFVVTNAAIGVVSFRYSPVFGQTNYVERNFW